MWSLNQPADDAEGTIIAHKKNGCLAGTIIAHKSYPTPHITTVDKELADCLMFHPKFDEQGNHCFHFRTIHEYQQKDAGLIQLVTQPNDLHIRRLGTFDIICKGTDDSWTMIATNDMLPKIVSWYHRVTMHAEG